MTDAFLSTAPSHIPTTATDVIADLKQSQTRAVIVTFGSRNWLSVTAAFITSQV